MSAKGEVREKAKDIDTLGKEETADGPTFSRDKLSWGK